ncbi:MAG: AAA family ATPase [Bacteroidota bacterium]
MKIWRIGSQWGKQIDLIDIFREQKLAFAGSEVQALILGVSAGDLLCITKGQSIEAIGRISKIEDLGIVNPALASQFDYVKALLLNELHFLKDFNLPMQSYGGQGKQFHEVHGNYFNLIKDLFFKIETMLTKINAIDLLKYKKQIILQGPPGTGKTYLAKKIAKELIAPKDLGSPLQKIDSFFETFNSKRQEYLKSRQEKEKLLLDFQMLFPKEKLKDLSLNSYCIGTGVRDNFCWWIERGLKPLGYYFPGSSQSYLIYWSQKEQTYKTHYRSLKAFKNIESAEEGIRIISDLISSLVNHSEKVDFEELPFGWSFILKILHSYYPEKYFPANGQNYMSNILNLLGQENSTKSPLEKNLLLQAFFEKKKAEFGADVKNFEFMTWLDNEFDLKGDIDLTDQKLISKGEFKLIQFHPAYTYEDFVRGIVVETNDGPHPEYKVVNKVLAEFATKALENKSSNYVLIIDEINRANLPSVLGELIYALEYRFDPQKPEETSVESMYSLSDEGESEGSEGRILRLPNNLFIIGTMNTADRSVGHIDYAIRRRFAFVNVPPSEQPILDEVKDKQTQQRALELFRKVSGFFHQEYLNSDFDAQEVQLGHSYFLAKDEATLKLKLDFEIKPLLKEYVKDGILKEKASEKIKELSL